MDRGGVARQAELRRDDDGGGCEALRQGDVGAQVLAKQTDLKPEQKFQLLTSPSHIGLNKNEEGLKKVINDTIAGMLADGSLNAASEEWLKTPLNPDNLKD